MKKLFSLLILLLSVPAFSQWSKMNVDVPDFTLSNVYKKSGHEYVTSAKGLYKSTNHGTSWSQITTNLPDSDLHNFFTTDSGMFVQSVDGYYASTKDESAWHKINSTTGRLYQGSGSTIYKLDVGTNNNPFLFYSTDHGASWELSLQVPSSSRSLFGNRAAYFYQIDFFHKKEDTLVYTTNGRQFIKTITTGLPAKGTSGWEFGFMPIAANDKYLFAHSNSGPKNLLYRLDLQSYVWSIANLPHDFTSLALQFMGNDILISTETEIWISSNEGNTWSKTAIAGFNSTIIRGIIEVAPQTYLAWTPEGIVQSIDTGITWTRSSTGLPLSSNFNSVTYNDGEYLVHGYGSSRNEVLPYLFSNNGSDWRYPTMEERHHVSQPYSVLQNGTKFSLQNDSGKLFLFKSLTGTKVWNKISGQIDGLASLCTQGNILYVEITVGASHDHGVDGFSISSLHRSVDEGQDFEELSASLAPIGAINANISLIGSDSTFIYLEKMTSDTTKQIFRSLASPINWEYIFTASISSTIHLNRNAVYVYDGWVHTLRIYEKDTLKRVPTPANEGRFYTSPYSNTLYYANLAPDTQETSIFQSTDLGNNWTSIADNLPEHIKVNDIDFSKTQIFIATDQGLFQRESNSVVTYVDSEVENLVVKLIQCYPQPASHQLNVALTDKIEVDGAFVVQIRSTTGKVLEEFIEDTKTFMVNVTAYKSGMYFLTIYQKQKKYDVNFLIN